MRRTIALGCILVLLLALLLPCAAAEPAQDAAQTEEPAQTEDTAEPQQGLPPMIAMMAGAILAMIGIGWWFGRRQSDH